MPNPAYEDLFKLPFEARMDLVYDLLESMQGEPGQMELQPWESEELDRRQKDAFENPEKLISWEDVRPRSSIRQIRDRKVTS